MAEVVLFHHTLGLTDGMREFAAALAAGGHRIHTPELFDGRQFSTIEEGVAYAQGIGPSELQGRLDAALAGLPDALVFAGVSWGVMHAQRLAQGRPGARGALLYEACLPLTGEWGVGPWPAGVPVQIHGKDHDEFFAGEGDLAAATELVEAVGPEMGELFVYPGEQHLFIDRSLPGHDAAATALVVERSLAMLDRLG